MTTKDFTNLVCDRIFESKRDKHLETIMAACNARRRMVRDQTGQRNMLELNEKGKRVRIKGNIRPKYLLGYEGTVVDRPFHFRESAGTIYVYLGTKVRRYGPVVGVPASAVEAA